MLVSSVHLQSVVKLLTTFRHAFLKEYLQQGYSEKKYRMQNMPHLIKCLSRPSQMSSQLQISWIPSFHPDTHDLSLSLMSIHCNLFYIPSDYHLSVNYCSDLSVSSYTFYSSLHSHFRYLSTFLTSVAQKTLQHDIIFNFRSLFRITLMDFKEF